MRILYKKRKEYKRKFVDKDKCVFCDKSEALECPSLKSKFWQVFANKFPYMDGNVMIVSQRHIERVEDVTDEEWADFGEFLAKTQRILGEIFEVDSFNVGLNVGPESGASIPHLHWQVVPRKFKNITVMNTFADLYVVAVSGEETVQKIEEFLDSRKEKRL